MEQNVRETDFQQVGTECSLALGSQDSQEQRLSVLCIRAVDAFSDACCDIKMKPGGMATMASSSEKYRILRLAFEKICVRLMHPHES